MDFMSDPSSSGAEQQKKKKKQKTKRRSKSLSRANKYPSKIPLTPYEKKQNAIYVAQMEKECKEWAEIKQQRIQAHKLAVKEVAEEEPFTFKSVEKFLSEEDKAFIAAKPDYAKILQAAQEAHDAWSIVKEEYAERCVKVEGSLEKAQKVLDKVTHKILHRKDPVFDAE